MDDDELMESNDSINHMAILPICASSYLTIFMFQFQLVGADLFSVLNKLFRFYRGFIKP